MVFSLPSVTVVSAEVSRHLRGHGLRFPYYLRLQGLMVLTFTFVFFFLIVPKQQDHHEKRSWREWDDRADFERCSRQERTATLLAFWLGVLGIDQWYARHWVLAVFKMITLGGLGVWAVIDINLWVVGGYYGTPGCPGGSKREWAY